MGKCTIGTRIAVFHYGVKTVYRYAGNGEWGFISGINSPFNYESLMMITK